MAQFYAQIQGCKGIASHLGSKKSGLWATVNGWNVGVTVECSHVNGRDLIQIYRTGGSNNTRNRVLLATLLEGDPYQGKVCEDCRPEREMADKL